MFKKSDPWEAGLKMFSKLLGFDVQQESQTNSVNKGTNGLLSLNSNKQTPAINKSQQKTFQLKQKWRRLMKFPSKIKYRQVIQLLKQGSAIEDDTWVWMLKNSQKISPQLYTQRKQQFHQIVYPKNPSAQQPYHFAQSTNQIQDFEQESVGFTNNKGDKQHRRRKFSITKNGIFLKSQASNLTGKMSLNSQCSTFSSQTHNSNEMIQPDTHNQTSLVDTVFCSKQNRLDSPQNVMKSSFVQSYSSLTPPLLIEENCAQPNSFVQPNYLAQSSLQMLPQKISHPILTTIIGAFLLHRQDFSYSITLFNMTATFFYYTNSNEMKTFTLLNHAACSEFFVHYLTNNWQQTGRIITWIAQKSRKIPSCAHGLRNFRLQNFIQNWLYGFFYSICQNGSQVKQKIIGYLLINNFTIESISKVFQSLILSLSKIISQGFDDKTYECLQNPKIYIDKSVLFNHLLRYEQ